MDNLNEEDIHLFKKRLANCRKKERCLECRQQIKEKIK